MTPPNDFRERLPELLDERAPQRAPEELSRSLRGAHGGRAAATGLGHAASAGSR